MFIKENRLLCCTTLLIKIELRPETSLIRESRLSKQPVRWSNEKADDIMFFRHNFIYEFGVFPVALGWKTHWKTIFLFWAVWSESGSCDGQPELLLPPGRPKVVLHSRKVEEGPGYGPEGAGGQRSAEEEEGWGKEVLRFAPDGTLCCLRQAAVSSWPGSRPTWILQNDFPPGLG